MGEIRSAIRNGADVQTAIQIAVSSGHGIGKTGFVAWIILWFMSTRDFPQVVVTAKMIGEPEYGKIAKLCIVPALFAIGVGLLMIVFANPIAKFLGV